MHGVVWPRRAQARRRTTAMPIAAMALRGFTYARGALLSGQRCNTQSGGAMGEMNLAVVQCVLRALLAKAWRRRGCCLGSALELRTGEKESESESESVGEWMAVSSPFRLSSVGRRRRTATTTGRFKSAKGRFSLSKAQFLHHQFSQSVMNFGKPFSPLCKSYMSTTSLLKGVWPNSKWFSN